MPLPTPPASPRIAYDLEGWEFWRVHPGSGAVRGQVVAADVAKMNDEDVSDFWHAGEDQNALSFRVPRAYSLTHYFLKARDYYNDLNLQMEKSVDSTNGVDGTWTAVQGIVADEDSIANADYRSPVAFASPVTIAPGEWLRIRNIRYNNYWYHLHLYGHPTVADDRLEMWHPTLNQRLTAADLDFGDSTRGGTVTRSFRVKNQSAALTASSITLARSLPTDTSPSSLADFTLSYDGGAFGATATIPALAPGAVSAVAALRHAPAAAAPISPLVVRATAAAGSWA